MRTRTLVRLSLLCCSVVMLGDRYEISLVNNRHCDIYLLMIDGQMIELEFMYKWKTFVEINLQKKDISFDSREWKKSSTDVHAEILQCTTSTGWNLCLKSINHRFDLFGIVLFRKRRSTWLIMRNDVSSKTARTLIPLDESLCWQLSNGIKEPTEPISLFVLNAIKCRRSIQVEILVWIFKWNLLFLFSFSKQFVILIYLNSSMVSNHSLIIIVLLVIVFIH